MSDYAYYNGVYSPYDATAIPLYDRSIFFADAVYEVMIGRNGRIHNSGAHFSRLRQSAEAIGLSLGTSLASLEQIGCELISLSGYTEYTVYLQVSGRDNRRRHVSESSEVNVLMTVTELTIPSMPEEISAVTYPDKRYEYCHVKTTNLLPAVISLRYAAERGAEAAILYHGDYVTECSHASLLLLKNGVLITPPLSNRILPGITRADALVASGEIGLCTEEREIRLDELYDADAVLISSTTHLLRICTHLDGRELLLKDRVSAITLFERLRSDFDKFCP